MNIKLAHMVEIYDEMWKEAVTPGWVAGKVTNAGMNASPHRLKRFMDKNQEVLHGISGARANSFNVRNFENRVAADRGGWLANQLETHRMSGDTVLPRLDYGKGITIDQHYDNVPRIPL